MDSGKKNYFKFILGLIACLLVRMIPLRAPNVEPILATTMPISRSFGAFAGFSFAALSILLYDILTGTLGVQTFFTAGAYGIVGLWSAKYFKNFKKDTVNRMDYVRFAIWGTLFFDALTGLTVGPIFFHQSFLSSVMGQIPFTLLHLAGNVAFAFILSPAIYNFMVRKRKKPPVAVISSLHPKTI